MCVAARTTSEHGEDAAMFASAANVGGRWGGPRVGRLPMAAGEEMGGLCTGLRSVGGPTSVVENGPVSEPERDISVCVFSSPRCSCRRR